LAFTLQNGCCGTNTSQVVLVQSPAMFATGQSSPVPVAQSSTPSSIAHGSGEFHDNGYRLRIRGRFASHLERRRSDHQLHQRNSAPRLRTRQSCGVVGHGHHHRHQPRAGRRKVRLPHLHHQLVRDSTVRRCTNPTQHRSLGGIFISTPRYIPRPPCWKQQCPATTTRSCHSEPARSGGESLP
jgi:hypothetical protein